MINLQVEKMGNNKVSYDWVCFKELAYEFCSEENKETEKKIKQRLKYYNLGNYNQGRVDYIRQLKNELHTEIRLYNQSKYFQETKSRYASFDNFDISRMVTDYLTTFDKIAEADMCAMLNFAIYLYWLR
jgi:hypothetical protein